MTPHRVVGYGSLINKTSVERTIASDREFKPVRVYGWRRIFNLVGDEGRETKRMDKAVLNVMPDKDAFFNGVLFVVDDTELECLKRRENEYTLVETMVHCFHTNKQLDTAFLFAGKPENVMYFVHPDPDYYQLCQDGAASFGKEFLKEWEETTFHACGKKVHTMRGLSGNQ